MAGIKRWFQDKIGIGENRDKIAYLEKRIKLNQALIQQLTPATLPLNLEGRTIPFMKAHKPDLFNLAIHKNDLMFLSILLAHESNINSSLQEYYQVGHQTAQWLKQQVAAPVSSVLDFGAGYGRVSRFLKSAFPDASITMSEIKAEAVLFHQSTLHIPGILHGADAASFQTDQSFDLIFAGSVFTHLPESSSRSWLEKLAGLLSKNGSLIFSIHNAASFGVSAPSGFAYKTLSEDEFFSSVEDSISDNESYGTAYFTARLINQWMTELGLHCRVEKNAFGGIQDVVTAHK